jgi:hypothetical protein
MKALNTVKVKVQTEQQPGQRKLSCCLYRGAGNGRPRGLLPNWLTD